MKKNKIIYLIFLIAICLTLFVSCEEEETFDCPEIEANIKKLTLFIIQQLYFYLP